jgi:hypothetical protein
MHRLFVCQKKPLAQTHYPLNPVAQHHVHFFSFFSLSLFTLSDTINPPILGAESKNDHRTCRSCVCVGWPLSLWWWIVCLFCFYMVGPFMFVCCLLLAKGGFLGFSLCSSIPLRVSSLGQETGTNRKQVSERRSTSLFVPSKNSNPQFFLQ